MVLMGSLLAGCTEMQQIAGEAARLSGQPGLAASVQRGATMAQQAGSALLPIGEEEERSIGAALALQVVTRYGGIYEHPELTRYVNLVGQVVALTCDRANLDYHFAILNHDSINAFATPAGYVFITKGLLQHLQNEAEFAAVLGHEIGHISEKHILKILQREKQIAGITEAGLTYVNQNPALFKGLIDAVAKKLLDEGLDQEKELEADRLGVVFAARVGYESTAYRTLLQRLRAVKGDDRAFFKTHPNFSTRLAEVEGVLGTQQLKSTGVLLPERFLHSLEGRL
jgi:predicted Zn-dependent protease